jgi:glucosyl-dolichyl phosphate glucuronosyltransferase
VDVSIIIPTCNRSGPLRRALASLLQVNHLPDDHEVIVVDNASSDDTQKVVEEAAKRRPTRSIRYFYEPIPGLLSGRHRGALESKGEICAFIDDDVQVGSEWLLGLSDAFRDVDVVLVGGPSRPNFQVPPPDWLDGFYAIGEGGRSCGWLSLLDGGDCVKPIQPSYIWGLNFNIRRRTLFNHGGFHPDSIPKPLQRFQGDGETGLACEVAVSGLKALYHPSVLVHHEIPAHRLTIAYFEQRAFYQGVCDSFTQVRANRRLSNGERLRNTVVRSVKRILGVRRLGKTGHELVHHKTSRAYDAGFCFHQNEVRRDPQLLEWVLRKDYWDYQLPKGWESFLPKVRSLQVSA